MYHMSYRVSLVVPTLDKEREEMSVSEYYEIVFCDALIQEEWWELSETATLFGIDRCDRTSSHVMEITFVNDRDEELREILTRIASWTARIALDTCIVNIKKITRYDTNYENQELNELLLTQPTRGSC